LNIVINCVSLFSIGLISNSRFCEGTIFGRIIEKSVFGRNEQDKK